MSKTFREALDIAGFVQAPSECRHERRERFGRSTIKEPDHRHSRLLPPRRHRPRGRRAADKATELTSSHVRTQFSGQHSIGLNEYLDRAQTTGHQKHRRSAQLISLMGHFRQIDPLPTLSACPLRSDRVRTFAPQRIDAVCQNRTHAPHQTRDAGVARLLDYLIGAQEKRLGHRQAERLGGGQIDDKLEFGRLFDWDVTGLGPAKNLID
jgi:hypothetical protein